jgi:FkbM family methyltransferase
MITMAARGVRRWLSEKQPDHVSARRAELERWISVYRAFTEAALAQFPDGQVMNLERTPREQWPLIRTFLPRGAVPDRYAPCFEQRLRLLGQDVARTEEPVVGDRILLVDIRERAGRRPNEIHGAVELSQAGILIGLDRYAHIRSDTVRKTLRHCDQMLAMANSLGDELSRMTALALICDQLSGLPLELPPLSLSYDRQYFRTGLMTFGTDEVIIDAGAATGDSLAKYREVQPRFARYHAFEPDPVLGRALHELVERDYQDGRVVASDMPLAERSGPVKMIVAPGSGNTLAAPDGQEQRNASSIDDYLDGRPATIIKMDVEGAEPELLRGAARTIRQCKPKLLVSVYHEIEHLFQIPDIIRSIRPDYQFYLRNHSEATEIDSWPGKFFCETVLYAC